MMGTQSAPAQLFYDFDLDEHVPANHMLREIDRFLDVDGMRKKLRPFYSHLGRPSIDPELIVRMLVIGYVMGIRSERRLCDEVHLNLAYRWFCRLGLDGRVPDHSTFSKYRHGKFRESDLLRHVFEATVERCLKEDLVSGEGFAVDASLIPADANKTRSLPASEWSPEVARKIGSRAAREYLETLDDAAFGAAWPSQPKFVARSDPAAQWTRAEESRPYFAYATNYLIDTESSVIMDVEATRAIRQAEVGASQTMLDRTERRFGIKPDWIAADTAYGSAENLGWLVKPRGIIPFIPVIHCPAGDACIAERGQGGTQRRHLVTIGLRMGRGERPVHLPGRAHPAPVPPQLLRSDPHPENRWHQQISGSQGQLSGLPIQGSMLSEHGL